MLGLFLAISINTVLIQISINPYFNIYFGSLFLALGLLLLLKLFQKNQISSGNLEAPSAFENPK
jgi:hypothetical protein